MNTNKCDIVKPIQVRKIKPTRRSVSGHYSFRGETSIDFESTLERDFIMRTEYFNHVLDIVPQPAEISFTNPNGRKFTYTPDFLVIYRLGNRYYGDFPKPMLVEVKPEGEWKAHWREWLPKWKAARRYAKEQDWTFRIYDESRIRDKALENIRFLERYKRMHFPIEECRVVLQTVEELGGTQMHHLLARYFMGMYRAEGIALIWHLVATRQLDCDITRALNEKTDLWVANYE